MDIALGAVADAQFAIVHEFLDEAGRVVSVTGGDVAIHFMRRTLRGYKSWLLFALD